MGERAAPVVASFLAGAAERGERGPIRVVEHGSRAWRVPSSSRDALLVDEFGDLWWARLDRPSEARVIRAVWPEERRRLWDRIARALRAR